MASGTNFHIRKQNIVKLFLMKKKIKNQNIKNVQYTLYNDGFEPTNQRMKSCAFNSKSH